MVVAPLDHHVAGLQVHLILVHHHINLAGHNDRVIDGIGGVHAGMARAFLLLGADRTDIGGRLRIAGAAFRCEFDNPEDRAIGRRRNADGAVRGIRVALVAGRGFLGHPQKRAGDFLGGLAHIRRVPVKKNDRFAVFIVPGNNPSDPHVSASPACLCIFHQPSSDGQQTGVLPVKPGHLDAQWHSLIGQQR